jgi:Rps23 Pro-64 3,4-dihydroxylase Tpa1-like proline 4-hydroxylase
MQWSDHLEKFGYVQINNFLPKEQATQLRRNIINVGTYKTWTLLTTPYGPCENIRDKIHTRVIDKIRHAQARQAYKRRQFAFSFYRSANKFKEKEFNQLRQRFTDHVLTKIAPSLAVDGKLNDVFVASFRKGQFLNYHSDGSAGKYAFVYQLSCGWKELYGGHLELYPKQIKFYKKNFLPKFNAIILLKLSHPMFHSVRLLNNPKEKHRITISGWLE